MSQFKNMGGFQLDCNKFFGFKLKISILKGFILGSFLLIAFSLLQKILLGINPFLLKAYVVPFLFGGITGALLSDKCAKVKDLNVDLRSRINELEEFLPICSHCKKIREWEKDPNDSSSWKNVEEYISEKTSSRFSHGLCPDCLGEQYPEFQTVENSIETQE